MKYCKKGSHEVSEENFNKSKKAKDGLQSYCRDCQKSTYQETWAGYYQENCDKRRENTKRWKQSNPEKRASIDKARYASLVANTPWPVLSDYREIVFSFYGRKCLKCDSTEDLTIDHMKPFSKQGEHGLWNMQPLCRSCNSSKAENEIDYRPWPRLLDRRVT